MGELIPILGVSIPLVVVLGKFVIQPLAEAVTKTIQQSRREEDVAPVAQRLAETEERLERIERSLVRLLEEQEFRRELGSARSGAEKSDPG